MTLNDTAKNYSAAVEILPLRTDPQINTSNVHIPSPARLI
jgi:hypothetical protein